MLLFAQLRQALLTPPACLPEPPGPTVMASGLLALLVGCGAPLVQGIASGWPAWRVAAYLALALLLVVAQLAYWWWLPVANWLAGYLALAGLLGFSLQALSGDPFIQPIIFTVPLVNAAMGYAPLRVGLIGAGYLGLLVLGLLIAGTTPPDRLIYPLVAYGALMVFMYAFTRLSIEQSIARAQADRLAADLARERDDLARLVAENARLAQQASRLATLAERNRLARELHDTIAQGLTAVTMQLEAAQRGFERDPARTRARLSRAHELARDTLDNVRQSVWALAEPAVDATTLGAALDDLVQQFAARTGLDATYQQHGQLAVIDTNAANQVLRIVQEALHNVEKHADASHVLVATISEPGQLLVEVRDNGGGFVCAPTSDSAPPRQGFGLRSLDERARLAGGALQIESAPGNGTRVMLQIPLARG